jgi:hypothetical protein
VELRKIFDRVPVRGGWKAGDIRSRALRHTYCAPRLQTLDSGAPVSLFTAAREMGHGGNSLVRRIYGHLGEVRHRAEAVEYRVEPHATALGHRLAAMQTPIGGPAVTFLVTPAQRSPTTAHPCQV